jgi:hypothetical protein
VGKSVSLTLREHRGAWELQESINPVYQERIGGDPGILQFVPLKRYGLSDGH